MKKYLIAFVLLAVAVTILLYAFKDKDMSVTKYDYSDFVSKLTFDMNYDDIVKTFGEPARDIGSGINMYVYELVDKTQVWIGYAGKIMYARHMNADGTIIANLFDQATYTNTTAEKIIVSTPYPGAVTGKEFSVLGEAAGWYFEASFPVEVIDLNNNVLWQGPAQALSDWMTASLVAFKADVKITNGYTGPATLILRKDNPSGEPANDASMSMPINISY